MKVELLCRELSSVTILSLMGVIGIKQFVSFSTLITFTLVEFGF